MDSAKPARLLRISQVLERVPLCRVQIDRLEMKGQWPRRVRLGPNSVAWVEADVEAWIAQKQREAETAPTTQASPSTLASVAKAGAARDKAHAARKVRQLATA